MPLYHFTAIADTTVLKEREQYDYPTLEFAKQEARAMLITAANERFSAGGCDMISVEIYDDQLRPLSELRLLFQEIGK